MTNPQKPPSRIVTLTDYPRETPPAPAPLHLILRRRGGDAPVPVEPASPAPPPLPVEELRARRIAALDAYARRAPSSSPPPPPPSNRDTDGRVAPAPQPTGPRGMTFSDLARGAGGPSGSVRGGAITSNGSTSSVLLESPGTSAPPPTVLTLRFPVETPEQRDRRERAEALARYRAAHPPPGRDRSGDGGIFEAFIKPLIMAFEALDLPDHTVFELRGRLLNLHALAGIQTDYAAMQFEIAAARALINQAILRLAQQGHRIDSLEVREQLAVIMGRHRLRTEITEQVLDGIVALRAMPPRPAPRTPPATSSSVAPPAPAPASSAGSPIGAVHGSEVGSEVELGSDLPGLRPPPRTRPPLPMHDLGPSGVLSGALDARNSYREAVTAALAQVGRVNMLAHDHTALLRETEALARDVEAMQTAITVRDLTHQRQLDTIQNNCREVIKQSLKDLAMGPDEVRMRGVAAGNRKIREKIATLGARTIHAQPPDPSIVAWATFVAQVEAGWRAYVRSGYSKRVRGANNHRAYAPPASVLQRIAAAAGGTININGATYHVQNSDTAGVSLHRKPKGHDDYIFHL